MALTAKQQLFVTEYLQCFNATQAAIAAGYSEKTARSSGARLLTNVDIAQAVAEHLRESAMSADEVLMRLAEQARGIPSHYLDADGNVMIGQVVADNKAHLIKKISDTAQGRIYEFYDAQSALQLLGRHHALFTDKSENRNYDINVSDLTDEQLDMLIADEPIEKVLKHGRSSS